MRRPLTATLQLDPDPIGLVLSPFGQALDRCVPAPILGIERPNGLAFFLEDQAMTMLSDRILRCPPSNGNQLVISARQSLDDFAAHPELIGYYRGRNRPGHHLYDLVQVVPVGDVIRSPFRQVSGVV